MYWFGHTIIRYGFDVQFVVVLMSWWMLELNWLIIWWSCFMLVKIKLVYTLQTFSGALEFVNLYCNEELILLFLKKQEKRLKILWSCPEIRLVEILWERWYFQLWRIWLNSEIEFSSISIILYCCLWLPWAEVIKWHLTSSSCRKPLDALPQSHQAGWGKPSISSCYDGSSTVVQ